MKHNLGTIKEILININKETNQAIYARKKEDLKNMLNSSTLFVNDPNNPLQAILTSYLFSVINECVKTNEGTVELVDLLNKFTNNTLVDSSKPNVKTTKVVVGYDLMGRPIYEEVEVKSIGNIPTKNGNEFNTVLETTGNLNYDKYLDELNDWSKKSGSPITKDTNLSNFCHILNLFQKSLKLTQPEENPTSIYRSFIKRFFHKS